MPGTVASQSKGPVFICASRCLCPTLRTSSSRLPFAHSHSHYRSSRIACVGKEAANKLQDEIESGNGLVTAYSTLAAATAAAAGVSLLFPQKVWPQQVNAHQDEPFVKTSTQCMPRSDRTRPNLLPYRAGATGPGSRLDIVDADCSLVGAQSAYSLLRDDVHSRFLFDERRD